MNFSLLPSAFILLFGRRWWWVTLLVVVLAALFIRLGIWQLDRLEQRRASNAVLEQALAAPPLDLNSISLPDDLTTLANRFVTAAGQYDDDQQLILRLQSWQGQPGVHLVTPLVLSRGVGEQGSRPVPSTGSGRALSEVEGGAEENPQFARAILVDRGWIPDNEVSAANLAQFQQPGEQTIDGYVALSQTLLRQPDSASAPRGAEREIFRVNVNAIAPTLPYELLPFYIVESPTTAANTSLPYHEPRQVDLSEGPHLGYAIQWFLFSFILLAGYIAYVNKHTS